jgi:hypothetical protein
MIEDVEEDIRHQQLRDGLKKKAAYWKLKQEALDRTLRRTHFSRRYGPVVGQTTGMNEFGVPVNSTSRNGRTQSAKSRKTPIGIAIYVRLFV